MNETDYANHVSVFIDELITDMQNKQTITVIDILRRLAPDHPENARVRAVLGSLGLLVVAYGGSVAGETEGLTFCKIARDIRLVRERLKLNQITDRSIDDALSRWRDAETKARFQAICQRIERLPGDVDARLLYNGLENLCGRLCACSEAVPARMAADLLRKFIWQVKRKIFRIPVTNHLMVVIAGKQGTGKSTLISSLVEPVAELKKPVTFDDLTEVRHIDLWSNYVMVLDEMSRARKADMDTVKFIITAGYLTRRPMGTNGNESIRQSATFIGTTNASLADLIVDPTGLRRFAEIKFRDKLEGSDAWADMLAFDWLGLWQSVDHHGPDPMADWQVELRDQQEANRSRDPVEAWIEDLNPMDLINYKNVTDGWVEVSAKDAFSCFEQYRERFCGSTWRISIQAWGRAMGRLADGRIEKSHTRNGPVYRFPVGT